MKKIFLVLFGFISIVSLFCNEGIKVSKDSIAKSLKLNGLLGSISDEEENCTNSVVPVELSDGIMQRLILEYGEDSEYVKTNYENLIIFNDITFGYNPVYADHVFNNDLHVFTMDRKKASFGNIHKHYIQQGKMLVSDIFNYSKGITKEEEIVRVSKQEMLPKDFTGDFYFVLPNNIAKCYSLTASIKNKEYVPFFVAEDTGYSMYALDKEIKSIKKGDEIKFSFKDKKGEVISLTYEATPINDEMFYDSITLLDRMDKRLSGENPELCYHLASLLHKEDYKYNVSDLKKETVKIRKRVEKNLKSKGVEISEEEKECLIEEELNKAIKVDIEKLSILYEKEKDTFYNSYNLFHSNFALYENASFIIGLKSIYLSSIDTTAIFTSKD